MSHVVTLKTEVRDAAAVRAACQRLGLPAPVQGTTELFSGEVEGLAVQLPDWHYPVVADLASGKLSYDDFGGRWGDARHLDRFLQAYAVNAPGPKLASGATPAPSRPSRTARSN